MTRLLKTSLILLCAFGGAAALRAHDCDGGFTVSVLVDGKPAPEYAGRGRIYIEALKGREFTIRLSNPTRERVAVALSVDGRNVVDAKRTTDLAATKWILAPGQTADIPGWQVSGDTSRKFFFTETSKSYAKWLGDTANVGTIEAVFFREKRREPAIARKDEADIRERRARIRPGRRRAGSQCSVREPRAKGDAGRQLRGHGHRRPDALSGPVGRFRRGPHAGRAHRDPLRVQTGAGAPRRLSPRGRALRPGSRPRVRA